MEYEAKFVLTTIELRELLMEAWVQGWYRKEENNDNGKREDSARIIGKLIDEVKLRSSSHD